MKKVVVFVICIIVIVVVVRAKMVEFDTNSELAEDYFVGVCGSDQGCADRLVRFRPCFSGAYSLSLIPGKDRVNVENLVQCLNGKYPIAKLDAVCTVEVLPFPAVR